MTLYERFKQLPVDVSQLGLGQGSGSCFCTPKGAEVIGWEGVDGIHYCFVKGFGEMVFAVNPSNLPGDYVHPLARSFEDFLRLLLACNGLAAAEQARLWDRDGFNAFLEEDGPLSPERRAALDGLRDGLGLAPMEDPYGYIREVQASFDYGKIPYRKDCRSRVPEDPGTPPRPEWKVYFDSGFGGRHGGRGKPGTEIPTGRTFTWGGKTWHVPAVYVCGKGMVVDLCMEVEAAGLRAHLEKWLPLLEGDREPTREEQDRQEAENPMTMDFDLELTVNGRKLRRKSGTGFGWVPASCRPEREQGTPGRQDWEAIWLMEHYGLDPGQGWMFWRNLFPWATRTRPAVKTVSLFLAASPVSIPGPRFTVSGAGDRVPFLHPVTGEAHTLCVAEYEDRELDTGRFPEGGQWEYPGHCTIMSYTVEPELPRESLTVQDCGEGDRPRLKKTEQAGQQMSVCSVGVIGVTSGSDGPVAFALANGACSALRFKPPKQIEWRMAFRQKTVEDIEVDLHLRKD